MVSATTLGEASQELAAGCAKPSMDCMLKKLSPVLREGGDAELFHRLTNLSLTVFESLRRVGQDLLSVLSTPARYGDVAANRTAARDLEAIITAQAASLDDISLASPLVAVKNKYLLVSRCFLELLSLAMQSLPRAVLSSSPATEVKNTLAQAIVRISDMTPAFEAHLLRWTLQHEEASRILWVASRRGRPKFLLAALLSPFASATVRRRSIDVVLGEYLALQCTEHGTRRVCDAFREHFMPVCRSLRADEDDLRLVCVEWRLGAGVHRPIAASSLRGGRAWPAAAPPGRPLAPPPFALPRSRRVPMGAMIVTRASAPAARPPGATPPAAGVVLPMSVDSGGRLVVPSEFRPVEVFRDDPSEALDVDLLGTSDILEHASELSRAFPPAEV